MSAFPPFFTAFGRKTEKWREYNCLLGGSKNRHLFFNGKRRGGISKQQPKVCLSQTSKKFEGQKSGIFFLEPSKAWPFYFTQCYCAPLWFDTNETGNNGRGINLDPGLDQTKGFTSRGRWGDSQVSTPFMSKSLFFFSLKMAELCCCPVQFDNGSICYKKNLARWPLQLHYNCRKFAFCDIFKTFLSCLVVEEGISASEFYFNWFGWGRAKS